MKKLLHQYVFSDNLPLDARMINLVYIIGLAAAVSATVSRFFIVNSLSMTLTMFAITFSVIALLYVSNRFSMHALSVWVMLVLLGNVLLPIAFFLLGGVDGGMSAYFVLSIVIVFMLARSRAFMILLPAHIVFVTLCYYVSYLFPDLVVKLSVKQQYMDSIQSFIVSGLFIGIVIKFQESLYLAEKEKGEMTAAALARRGELMRVVNGAAAILLASDYDKFEGALLKSLEMMARCVGVDRVYIWKNETRDGLLHYSEQYAWEDGEGLRSTSASMEFSYSDTMPSWEKTLSSGCPVNGAVSGFADEERGRLAAYGIVSILVIPVFLHNHFWGFVSFDDIHNERSFPDEEVEILQSGSLLLVNAIARDAMMRKMREAEERAKVMLDATPLCCNLWSRDFQVLDCNNEALKIFEAPDKEKYLENFFLYSPEFQPCGQSSFELASGYVTAAFRDGKIVFEWMHRTAGGEPIPSEVTLVRVNMGDQEILAGYTYDLRRYKKMLRDLDARFDQQQLMSAISQSFISHESMSVLINNALRDMGEFMGVSRVLIVVSDDEGDSRPIYVWQSSGEFAIQPSKSGLSDILTTAFPSVLPSKGGVPPIACNDIHADGKYSIFEEVGLKSFIWSPQYVDGKCWGILSVEDCVSSRGWSESDVQLVSMISSAIAGAVARDLFEQGRAEALEQAVKASKAKGDFLSNMSHEMRTPMNAIIGMTSIGKSAPGIEKKNYAFEKIENASTHLLGVINDILDMSKIEANKLELSFAEFNFEKMLQKVVNVVNFRVDEKHQDFSVTIDKAIPQMLIGDDQRLTQVITNLLSNAVKFTPEGGAIHLGAAMLGEENGVCTVRIQVTDTGIGITAEQQSRLFSSFEQAESGTARKFGGTGLGLAISKRIVEMMGGRIWIESEFGHGSTFAFIIRARRGKEVRRTMLDPSVNWGNVRIMAVDDAPEILEYFSEIASRFGVMCDTAAGGEDACALIEKNGSYDIYFVDWKMPGMNGADLAARIKESGPEKSIVTVISSSEWSAIEDEARAAGVDKFLPKPLFPSSIADCINECLGVNVPSPEKMTEETDDFEKYRILLAEDVEVNREIVLALLEPTKLSIDCAENGEAALRMFAAAPDEYDMIFMDVQMPEMDGYEATRGIRALGVPAAQTVPIVAMTANVFREDIEKCLAAGMNDHVGKPLNLDEVLEKLRGYLRKHRRAHKA